MKNLLRPVCATAVIAMALAGCKPATPEQSESITTEVAVHVGKVTRATLHRYVSAFGVVEPEPAHDGQPSAGTRLGAPVAGIVAEANCAEGQRVEKGAVLFRLDSRTVDVAVQSARLSLERQKKLLAVEGTSQKAVQEAEQQLAAALAQQNLLKVEAPFVGVITRVNARVGEAVDLTTVLAELVDPSRLVVAANVPAGELDGLKAGQPAEFTVEGKALGGRGTVSFVGPQIDPKTGTALVRASVPRDCGLRPGRYVQVRIASEELPNRLAVPFESVVRSEDGADVIALVEGDKAVQKPVKAGVRDGSLVEVDAEGLKEGATVVTVGAYGLPKETKIKVVGQ